MTLSNDEARTVLQEHEEISDEDFEALMHAAAARDYWERKEDEDV